MPVGGCSTVCGNDSPLQARVVNEAMDTHRVEREPMGRASSV